MQALRFLSFSLLFVSLTAFMPVKVGDVNLPDTFMAGKEKLILNGGGIRSKYLINLYIGGLYLRKKEKEPQKIVDANEEMCVRIHIVSSYVTNEKLEEAMREGFKTSMGGNSSSLKKEIDQIVGAFSDKVKIGDEYDMLYIPNSGVTIRKNGIDKITISGFAFKKALFGIWFGKVPADVDLEEGMLGKS